MSVRTRIAFLALVLLSIGPSLHASDLTVIEGETMGTTYRILIDPAQPADSLSASISDRLDELEQRMSTWLPDSEISRFNKLESNEWFEVSADTARVVAEALRIAELSRGAFDPTVAPLIRLWHFDGEAEDFTIPSDDSIEAAREHVGWQKLHVRMESSALRKDDPQLEINLSAIAKGDAVDEIARLIDAAGQTRYLVEIGGEMRARGRKSDGTQWQVGIEAPVAGERQLYRNQPLPLEDQSIATSGDYRNFFVVDGQRYSHTIDPATGRPVTHTVTSVSVVAESCMTADALATAINVMGGARGNGLASVEGAQTLILRHEGDDLVETVTDGFPGFGREAQLQPTAQRKPDDSAFGTFIAAAVIFGLAICGMAVGVIFSNRRLRGTCGGLNNMPGAEGSPCELCQTPADECRDPLKRFRRKQPDSTATDAVESEG